MTDQGEQEDKTVIFLGAGASHADGAPLQRDLFGEYFSGCGSRSGNSADNELLAKFFRDFFGIDVCPAGAIPESRFPTFEEVLGVIEIAGSQRRSFQGWGTFSGPRAKRATQLRRVHNELIFLIAKILHEKLRDAKQTHHQALVCKLQDGNLLDKTAFISLNYDILIDNALLNPGGVDVDYGFKCIGENNNHIPPNRPERTVSLFKLHGSLNWLYCPTCREMKVTRGEKGVMRLIRNSDACLCSKCEILFIPIIIPPTYFKALSNPCLGQVWHAAEQALLECGTIIFCGYSFPDADIHVRHLLKRMEVNGSRTPRIYVVNKCPENGVENDRYEMEKARYGRFFRNKERIKWSGLSFGDFANNPEALMGCGAVPPGRD